MLNKKDCDMILRTVLDELSKKLIPVTMNLWFSSLQIGSIDKENVVVIAESEFKMNFLDEKYFDVLKDEFEHVLGYTIKLRIVSPETMEEDSDMKSDSSLRDLIARRTESGTQRQEADIPAGDTRTLHPEYTFSSFVVGSSNEFAYTACSAVAKNPAKLYNPLFIHGSSGLGKTHLLYAIYNYVRENYPNRSILYVSGEDFTNQLIEALDKRKAEQMVDFRKKYRNVDILMVDDIQFIAGKSSTQEEFFHTFNRLYELEKQIILTSDKSPKEIPFLEERLQTRFEQGLIADVQPPNMELRTAIFKNKAEQLGIELSPPVLMFLAENIRNNVRQIEGTIKTLRAHALISGQEITIALTKEVLSGYATHLEESVTPEKIIDFICRRYGIRKDEIKGQSRTSEIKNVRHLCIYMIKSLTSLNYKEIGKIFQKDRTSIMYAYNMIDKNIKNDSTLQKEITQITGELTGPV